MDISIRGSINQKKPQMLMMLHNVAEDVRISTAQCKHLFKVWMQNGAIAFFGSIPLRTIEHSSIEIMLITETYRGREKICPNSLHILNATWYLPHLLQYIDCMSVYAEIDLCMKYAY